VWTAEAVFVCALRLLGRSQQSFPPVQLVQSVPRSVSPLAQGYMLVGQEGFVLVTSTSAFSQARRATNRCGNIEAIREIAGVLAHEEWHLRHGPDEPGAYDAQLTALLFVGADQNGELYHRVMQAKQTVNAAKTRKRLADAGTVERGIGGR